MLPHRSIGSLEVSVVGLGTNNFGGRIGREATAAVIDAALDSGIDFIDTADVYGDGESERTLAPWLARHRDEVVLATKLRMPVSDPPGEGLAPERVRAAMRLSERPTRTTLAV